jgi:hypothetical protein
VQRFAITLMGVQDHRHAIDSRKLEKILTFYHHRIDEDQLFVFSSVGAA